MNDSLVLFLIDETDVMATPLPAIAASGNTPQKKTRAEAICTLVNAQLNKLAAHDNVAVGIVGYQSDAEGNLDGGPRWQGALVDRGIVDASELASAVLRTEQRSRKIGKDQGTTFNFPIWYEMTPQGAGGYAAALAICNKLISEWIDSSAQPGSSVILFHIHAGDAASRIDKESMQEITKMEAMNPSPQILQVRMQESANATEILFPPGPAHLPFGTSRELLSQGSVLSEPMSTALKHRGFSLTAGAKGLLYNASLRSISQAIGAFIDLLSNTPEPEDPQANSGPEISPETGTDVSQDPDGPIHIDGVLEEDSADVSSLNDGGNPTCNTAMLFVFDRGTRDPQSEAAAKVVERLQAEANRHLQQLGKHDSGSIDVAVLAYGTIDGQPEVLSSIMQDAEKNSWAPNDSLEERAIRTEETEEQISNGAGGLLTIPRKNMIFLDYKATEKSDPRPAFKRAAAMISAWQASHPGAASPPLVFHLTSGSWNEAAILDAAKSLAESSTESILYHHIATELPHPSVAYPETENVLDHPSLAAAWQCTSLLINAGEYQSRSNITASSRGMVVNGRFDLMLDPLVSVHSG